VPAPHSFTVRSLLADASLLPSGEKTTMPYNVL
jgi:hypothetical protein